MAKDPVMFAAIQEALPRVFTESAGPLRMQEARPRIVEALRDRKFDPEALHREVYRHIHEASINENPKARRKGFEGVSKLLFNIKEAKTYRLLTSEERQGIADGSRPELSTLASAKKIARESIIRDYLIDSLSQLESSLSLWSADPPSKEYLLETRRLDILARDGEGNPVIVEVKLNSARHSVLGQALLYRSLVRKYLPASQKVRVFIVAQKITSELTSAARELTDFSFFEVQGLQDHLAHSHKLAFRLKKSDA